MSIRFCVSPNNNGTNYILVPNLPDVGLTPNSVAAGGFIQNLSTQFATQYNNQMFEGAKATGANIIPLDTFGLLQQVAADPEAYGFSNTTKAACKTESSLTCGTSNDLVEAGAENSYFFADSIHPTGRAHRMIADYANAVVSSPSHVGLLPHIATTSALATKDRLQSHIHQNQAKRPNTASGPSVWASADVNSLDIAGFESSSNNQLIFGLDFTHAGSPAVTGIYSNVVKTELDSNIRSGMSKVDMDELGVGVYHNNQIGAVKLSAALGYGRLDMDVTRRVSLDSTQQAFKSSTDGKRYYATLQAGYPIKVGDMAQFSNTVFTPYLEATANKVRLDGLKENEMTGVAMQFDKQEYDTTYGKIGLKASSAIDSDWSLFSDIYYQKQLDDDRKEVTARINTLSDISFTTPKTDIDDDSFGVSLGLARHLGSMTANAGVSHSSGDDDDATSVFVGLSRAF